jgi:acyl-coenzyme A thioesterase PaaI-like protein
MPCMLDYRVEALTDDELAREREVHGSLTQSTRELVDAVLRSTLADHELEEIRGEIDKLTARLRSSELPGPFGISVTPEGVVRAHGNAVVGLRNAVAPPVHIEKDPSGRAWAEVTLGAAYEGPPGMVHGGVSALLLDQLCGEAASAGGSPGMTGRLTLHYKRPTPLGPIHLEAHIARVEGIKTWVEGHIADADGVTIECEGLFILPRWARERLAETSTVPIFE